ncbi:MAG: acyltransferase family protein [Pikeienuella sp.]|uniref:acyltransferase family protein n=1 Tax=Pikeienuella sp. TaxID=2831957 RepID=UPI00391A0A49
MNRARRRTTIGDRLAESGGVGHGFDFLRIFLATGIVAYHVLPIAMPEVDERSIPLLWMIKYTLLTSFFALSGFLITGSALRLSLRNFLINRGLRIVPALSVEVVLCALVLGPLVTVIPLSEYFSSREFWVYLSNSIGIVHFYLPGVFVENPMRIVNINLWTVPHEIGCYVIISGFIIFGTLRRPGLVLAAGAATVAAGLFLVGYDAATGGTLNQGFIGEKVYRLMHSQVSRLYVGFLLGIAVFLYRDRIPYSPILALASAAFIVVGGLFEPETTIYPLMNLVYGPAVVYLTAYLGVSRIWLPKLFKQGDYSYGIYLYGFPIQQLVVHVAPGLGYVENLAISLVAIGVFAAFSWHFVEKPILAQRRRFSFVARVRLDDEAAETAPPVAAPEALEERKAQRPVPPV